MTAIDALKTKLYDIDALRASLGLMGWDLQVMMPSGNFAVRSAQLGVLERLVHDQIVSEETQRLVENARHEAAPGSVDEALVRVTQRNIDLQTKIPASLVEEKARLSGEGHEVWVKARAENDFKSFAPLLQRLVELTRQEAEHLGYQDHPYDAVTDYYEEGATKKSWEAMFDGIRQPLIDLVAAIKASPNQIDDSKLYGPWPEADQKAFCDRVARAIGFDFDRGRQDTAAHPFCGGTSVTDVRLTTRFKDFLPSAIMGTLHEAGHGMYEQGSPLDWARLPLAGGVSLGVHESQSRTWENIVGRSRPFWSFFYPQLQETFPALSDIAPEQWYKFLNKVEPSFIRVEADEVTYNLHIMVRFEIECMLMDGSLKVNELPEVWNSKYQSYLGITPATDSEGCLQDVHWSGGSIGYFPTYSMGNILSYQFWNCLKRDLGDVDALMAHGDFAPILGWLQKNIYSHGSRFKPSELVHRVTGKQLDSSEYLAGITAKYREIYALG